MLACFFPNLIVGLPVGDTQKVEWLYNCFEILCIDERHPGGASSYIKHRFEKNMFTVFILDNKGVWIYKQWYKAFRIIQSPTKTFYKIIY